MYCQIVVDYSGNALCKVCKQSWGRLSADHLKAINGDLTRIIRQCPAAPPGRPAVVVAATSFGPGSFLKFLIGQLELGGTCPSCEFHAGLMDEWGIKGCIEHRQEIITWLTVEFKSKGWLTKQQLRLKAVTSGLVFKINLLKPIPSLVDEAIRLSKEYRKQHHGN